MSSELAAASGTGTYDVVSPVGPRALEAFNLSAPVADLSGKTVVELWDWLFRGSVLFPIVRERLQQRFPGVRIVDYNAFGNTHQGGAILEKLPAFLRQHGADLVISGFGA